MQSDEASRKLELYKGLVEVSALINGIIDTGQLLPAILDVARRVLNVEAASLFLVNAAGDLELAAAKGGAGMFTNEKIIVPRGKGIAGWVLAEGKPLLVADAYSDARFFADVDRRTGFTTRSILCVPLIREGVEIGILQVLNPLGRTAFEESDIEPFQAYANLAATAIDKLRTLDRQREQQRAQQQLEFAREIQASFLPQVLPQHDRISFASTYRPALNVGGDFFDVMDAGNGELYFVIGDVSGKGVPAALLMAQALSMLRLILRPGISPGEALAQWNAMLVGRTIHGMFITAQVGRIDLARRTVEIANAGHCAPFHLRAGGEVDDVRLGGSPPLAILPQVSDRSFAFQLEPGEWLIFFTDGLIESYDPADEPLDRSGVMRLLQQRFTTPRDVIDALNAGELNHRRNADPHDDLTILVFGFS